MLHTDRPERTTPGAVLHAGDRTLVVASARPHQGRWLVRFEGITDRNSAEELRGATTFSSSSTPAPATWADSSASEAE